MPQEQLETIRFHSPKLFAGQTGVVDQDSCVIHGVSLITGNITATGHDLHVDSTTIQQLNTLAKEMEKVPVTLDHGAGVNSINGYVTNFRIDGQNLRADWHLLKSHKETPVMMERAIEQPSTFGMSVAFQGPKQGVLHLGKKCARAEKLLSADCVTRPAANPAGMFSVPENNQSLTPTNNSNAETTNFNMPSENQPTLQDLMTAIQGLTAQVQSQQETIDQLQQGAPGDEPSLADLANMTAEEVEARGYDVDRVTQAVSEAIASGELSSDDAGTVGDPEAGAEGAEAGAEGAEVGAAAGGAEGSAAFKALSKNVIALQAKINAQELAAKDETIEFAELQNKISVIVAQRDEAIELCEGLKAENDALRVAFQTGTRPAVAGVDNGIRMFAADENGELDEFQLSVKELISTGKAKSEGEAIRLSVKENPGRHAAHVQRLQAAKR